jgi:hypothetical protein
MISTTVAKWQCNVAPQCFLLLCIIIMNLYLQLKAKKTIVILLTGCKTQDVLLLYIIILTIELNLYV